MGNLELDTIVNSIQDHTSPDDNAQQLPAELISILKPAGYFSLLLPEYYGGAQMDYPDLTKRLDRVRKRREVGDPTVPGLLEEELDTNCFLRFDDPSVAQGRDPVETFTALREAKDSF